MRRGLAPDRRRRQGRQRDDADAVHVLLFGLGAGARAPANRRHVLGDARPQPAAELQRRLPAERLERRAGAQLGQHVRAAARRQRRCGGDRRGGGGGDGSGGCAGCTGCGGGGGGRPGSGYRRRCRFGATTAGLRRRRCWRRSVVGADCRPQPGIERRVFQSTAD